MKNPEQPIKEYQNDHDLLIRIDTKLGLLINQFDEHKAVSLNKITELQETKLDRDEADRILESANQVHDDHEKRLRRLEQYGAIALGALYVIQAIFGFKIF